MKKGLTEWKLEGYIVSAYVELTCVCVHVQAACLSGCEGR